MELLATVVIHEYVRHIQTVASRRATYYEKGKKKVPAKYANQIGANYQWLYVKGKQLLCNGKKEPVIANPKSAGNPKWHVLNFQDVHTLRLEPHTRSKILKAVKAQMIPEVEKLEPLTKFPIRILCELHDTFMDYMYVEKDGSPAKNINWDLDNRAGWYMKIFPDVLQGCPMIQDVKEGDKDVKRKVFLSKRVIPEDHRRYITQPPVPLFVPIEDTQQRKLVFKIYHDDREVIAQNKYYADNQRTKMV